MKVIIVYVKYTKHEKETKVHALTLEMLFLNQRKFKLNHNNKYINLLFWDSAPSFVYITD